MSALPALLALALQAQQVSTAKLPAPAVAPRAEARTVQAVRRSAPVALDGDLSDAAWFGTIPVSGFRQREPDEGAPATEPTEVKVLYDDEAIYIGARMFDSAPDSIVGRLARRDNWVVSDRFQVFLDPYHDRRTGFFFGVNAAGTLYDGTLMNDDWDNDTWDGIWDAKTRRDSLGWTVEMRIPYSQLRFQQGDRYLWGINFRRDLARRNEASFLSYTPRSESGFVSRFYDLQGVEQVRPPRRFEVVPYLTSKAEFVDHQRGDPFNDGRRFRGSAGADFKLGIGSNLTLDATVNPDFGQVEVDPAVVNLSDVETFYPEKRPFFIEGADIFDFGSGGANNFWGFNWPGPDLFYSRRIGRPPQGSTPDATFSQVPDGTTILGAAKLSGKIGHSLSVGGLSALTGRETARLQDSTGRFSAEVEPLTSYNLVRGQREFGQGRQGLGLLATGTFRDLAGSRLRDELNQDALALGVDGWTFVDRDKMWVITGYAAGSRVDGTRARITGLQQNSTHYFQRPDSRYVSVDSNATSLTGWAGRLWLNKQRGNWLVNAAVGGISPEFESNDLGFLSRTDVANGHFVLSRRWTDTGRLFRFARINAATFRSYDFDGDRIGEGYWMSGGATLLNYQGFEGYLAYNPDRVNPRGTRGGPRMTAPSGYEASLSYNTDDRKTMFGGVTVNRSAYSRGSDDTWGASLSLEWRPAAAVSVRVEPQLEVSRVGAQYVSTVEDATATSTFGSRYVFANLDQTTLSASLRLNWTFSPRLSLELYAQPLVSSGNYREFKELARPNSYDFRRFGTQGSTITPVTDPDGTVNGYEVDPGTGASSFTLENPDFSLASLRGNAVLRWEYLPGSTLFLVWTQDRSDDAVDGEFRFGRSLRRLVQARGNNIFAVKVSYWWHP